VKVINASSFEHLRKHMLAVSQPLAAVILNADASLQLLAKAKPDMDDLRAALKDIVDNGQRARAVLDGIRSMFRNDHGARTTVTVNDLIGDPPKPLGSHDSRHSG